MLINLVATLFSMHAYNETMLRGFLHGASHQHRNITFTVVTDLDIRGLTQDFDVSWSNIKVKHCTLSDISTRLREMGLGGITLSNGYKICDLRPLFGILFKDSFEGYTHWGWVDVDSVFGDIFSLSTTAYNDQDIIQTTRGIYANGPLAIFKFNDKIINIYREIPNLKEKLNSPHSESLDEVHFSQSLKAKVTMTKSLTSKAGEWECERTATWVFYNGSLRSLAKECAIAHYGGGDANFKRKFTKNFLGGIAEFYRLGYHKKSEYGISRSHNHGFFYFTAAFNAGSISAAKLFAARSPKVEVVHPQIKNELDAILKHFNR